ncbi:hypothetical protein [Halobacillus sp. A5]|uniref:hypothetical protein n=1 Tax=Halobacillus sp. A5 TaxID=2880263 RepID=UPI0020A6B1F0|nr:hypothetical protein [Halobacillus sp. A5]MCP3026632.1 hypothetical protein [Halobacillus sp. A5]
MKAICLDAAGSAELVQGNEYFVFPSGGSAYYVSRFDRGGSHFGCFQAGRFELMECQEPNPRMATSETKYESEDYEQLSIFDVMSLEDTEAKQESDQNGYLVVKAIIPEDVISPLECKTGPNSKAFKKIKERWSNYVRAIQDYEGCSWFKARDQLIEHREDQVTITLSIHPNNEFRPEGVGEGTV